MKEFYTYAISLDFIVV